MTVLIGIIVLIVLISYGNRIVNKLAILEKKINALEDSQPHREAYKNIRSDGQAASHTREDLEKSGDKQATIVPDTRMQKEVYHESITLTPDGPSEDLYTSPTEQVVGESDQKKSADAMFERFLGWIHEDWPLKIGGLLIIFAIGWFVSFAAAEGWLTEMMRVVMGYIGGVIALAYGVFRAEKVRAQGNTFMIIGTAALFVTTLAAVSFVSVQMPAILAISVMLLVVFFVTVVSLKQESIALTGSMLAFGGVVPLFFFDDLTTETIFAYLFVLTVGTLWVVARTGWRELTVMMLGVVGFYSIGYAVTELSGPAWRYMILALVFTAVFYAANLSAIIRDKSATIADVIAVIGITLLYLIWTYAYGPEEFRVALLLLGSVLFVSASYGIFRITGLRVPTILYGAASLILIGIATGELFEGSVLTLAYVLEMTVALVLTLFVRRERMSEANQMMGAMFFMGPMLMVANDIVDAFHTIKEIKNVETNDHYLDLFVIVIAAVCALTVGMAAHMCMGRKKRGIYPLVFGYFGLGLSIVFVWIATHTFLENPAVATFSALFVYMISGVAFYVAGVRRARNELLAVGAILFAIVLARIAFVEFWEMPITMRIVTFFVIGTLFVVAAYAARSHKEK